MYKFRLKILMGIFALVFIIILSRLAYMQIICGNEYREKARLKLSRETLIPGQRGKILDRNGIILATDEACHDFCLDYRFIVGDEKWRKRQINKIKKERDISYDEAAAAYAKAEDFTWQIASSLAAEHHEDLGWNVRRLSRNIDRMKLSVGRDIREMRQPHSVVGGLSEGQVNSLRPLLDSMVGASLVPSHKRLYPFGDAACHIIGTTRRIFAEDVQEHNLTEEQADRLTRRRKNYKPSDVIGGSGVEAAAEERLRFVRGYQLMSRPGEVSKTVPATNGEDIYLTIDIRLQRALTQLMKKSGHTGSIVVIDVKTGAILAMVSWPTYDLNTFRSNYNKLLKDTRNLPLHHRAIANAYAPGSTVKPFTGLIGCAAGKVTPHQTIFCSGKNPYARNGKPSCARYRLYGYGHDDIDLSRALKKSCNVYFATVGHRLGPDALSGWLKLFGFGEYPDTGLPEERKGVCADDAYLRLHKNRGFVPSDAWYMSIGQGVFAATPLQVAAAEAVIASRGEYRSPYIMEFQKDRQKHIKLNISQNAFDAIFEGMYRVVNEEGGTAYIPWQATGDPLGVKVCGKTGTAEVPAMRIDSDGDKKITTRDQIVKTGDMCWFTGFAPKSDPRVALSVLVEYSTGGGGTDAAPIAKEALRVCEKLGYMK